MLSPQPLASSNRTMPCAPPYSSSFAQAAIGSRVARFALVAISVFSIFVCAAAPMHAASRFQNQQSAQQSKPRRPLPKPPKGSRGFEQYAGKDASERLISMGATRGSNGLARKPVAPLEGMSLDARPFFLWEPAPQAANYRFTLYEGDVRQSPAAPVIFEVEVPQSQLVYPETAPALTSGKLYSWRVSAPASAIRDGSSGGVINGLPVNFFVLIREDADPVTKAIADAGVAAPTTPADHLRRAQILADYGMWYDALRIARELLAENPKDEVVSKFYSSLIAALDQ